MRFLKSSEVCAELKICPATLKAWKDKGMISYRKLSDKKYLYDVDSIIKDIKSSNDVAVYGRVSSSTQKEDLNRQVELLKSYCLSRGIKP